MRGVRARLAENGDVWVGDFPQSKKTLAGAGEGGEGLPVRTDSPVALWEGAVWVGFRAEVQSGFTLP